MASLWAFRATDMRAEIARGLLDSFSLEAIVINDGPNIDTFHGLFDYSSLEVTMLGRNRLYPVSTRRLAAGI